MTINCHKLQTKPLKWRTLC